MKVSFPFNVVVSILLLAASCAQAKDDGLPATKAKYLRATQQVGLHNQDNPCEDGHNVSEDECYGFDDSCAFYFDDSTGECKCVPDGY